MQDQPGGGTSIVPMLGFGATVITLVAGLLEYRRSGQWKRAEFVANEMKDFFGNASVKNVCTMIDWGERDIPLSRADSLPTTRVTRSIQCEALLPHTIKNRAAGSDQASGIKGGRRGPGEFSVEEAAIRDAFDVFLDGLERFGSYLESGLVRKKEIDPYLRYWIRDISAPALDPDDAAWTASVLTYISFYEFEGVQRLFDQFGFDIRPGKPLLATFLRDMIDRSRARELEEAVRRFTVR